LDVQDQVEAVEEQLLIVEDDDGGLLHDRGDLRRINLDDRSQPPRRRG
jgi:hypothetical protein